MLEMPPRMQLTTTAIAVAVVLIFIAGVFPLNYVWRRGLAITVVLIAVALFVMATMIRDRFRRRNALSEH
jgi:hypothetical protein